MALGITALISGDYLSSILSRFPIKCKCLRCFCMFLYQSSLIYWSINYVPFCFIHGWVAGFLDFSRGLCVILELVVQELRWLVILCNNKTYLRLPPDYNKIYSVQSLLMWTAWYVQTILLTKLCVDMLGCTNKQQMESLTPNKQTYFHITS